MGDRNPRGAWYERGAGPRDLADVLIPPQMLGRPQTATQAVSAAALGPRYA